MYPYIGQQQQGISHLPCTKSSTAMCNICKVCYWWITKQPNTPWMWQQTALAYMFCEWKHLSIPTTQLSKETQMWQKLQFLARPLEAGFNHQRTVKIFQLTAQQIYRKCHTLFINLYLQPVISAGGGSLCVRHLLVHWFITTANRSDHSHWHG